MKSGDETLPTLPYPTLFYLYSYSPTVHWAHPPNAPGLVLPNRDPDKNWGPTWWVLPAATNTGSFPSSPQASGEKASRFSRGGHPLSQPLLAVAVCRVLGTAAPPYRVGPVPVSCRVLVCVSLSVRLVGHLYVPT